MPCSITAAAVSASQARRDGHRALGRHERRARRRSRARSPRRRGRRARSAVTPGAHGGHDARALHARDERQRVRVEAGAVVDVDEVDAGRLHADHDLPGTGRRVGHVGETQRPRARRSLRFESPSWNTPAGARIAYDESCYAREGGSGVRKLSRREKGLLGLRGRGRRRAARVGAAPLGRRTAVLGRPRAERPLPPVPRIDLARLDAPRGRGRGRPPRPLRVRERPPSPRRTDAAARRRDAARPPAPEAPPARPGARWQPCRSRRACPRST